MAVTYEPIATTTLGSAGNIAFTSIPGTYTDLRIVITGTTSVNGTPYLNFNSDTNTNYSTTILYGNGTSALSTKFTNDFALEGANGTGTLINLLTYDIFSYAGSTNKTVLFTKSNDRNGTGNVERVVGLWRNTSAITRIDATVSGTTFAAGTTATLYGIKSA